MKFFKYFTIFITLIGLVTSVSSNSLWYCDESHNYNLVKYEENTQEKSCHDNADKAKGMISCEKCDCYSLQILFKISLEDPYNANYQEFINGLFVNRYPVLQNTVDPPPKNSPNYLNYSI